MKELISYQQTQKFNFLVNDYVANAESLQPFYNHYPSLEKFPVQWEEKSKHEIDRRILVEVLQAQNKNLNLSQLTENNIATLIDENTFTITTGHQLCLFTGPLYFIYKIISTINLTNELKVKYPKKHFVPVFWMASEDHDFQEVNHVHLFGKTLTWDSKRSGAVGSMSLEGIEHVLDELDLVLGESENAKKLSILFREAYANHSNLADASRFLVNKLFGQYGLVILDGDDARLKSQFVSVIKKDVLHQGFIETISDCSQSLAKAYKTQAFVREINFFKLSEGKRKRVEGVVSESEIEESPEKFSPNVLMRPLYQETVLPNLAYIGGGAEIAYWMQLKTAFEQESIPFPVLLLRNSALWMEQNQLDKWQKLGFETGDLFLTEEELHQQYVNQQTNLDLSKELYDLKEVFEAVLMKVTDKGLKSSVLAEQQKQFNSFKKLEKKLMKFEKQKHKTALNQISHLKHKLFPKNSLQERYDNFIPFYLKHGENFIEILQKELSPLDAKFVILSP